MNSSFPQKMFNIDVESSSSESSLDDELKLQFVLKKLEKGGNTTPLLEDEIDLLPLHKKIEYYEGHDVNFRITDIRSKIEHALENNLPEPFLTDEELAFWMEVAIPSEELRIDLEDEKEARKARREEIREFKRSLGHGDIYDDISSSDDTDDYWKEQYLLKKIEKNIPLTEEEIDDLPEDVKKNYFGHHSTDLDIGYIRQKIQENIPLNEEEAAFWFDIGEPAERQKSKKEAKRKAKEEMMEKKNQAREEHRMTLNELYKGGHLSRFEPVTPAQRKALKVKVSRQTFKAEEVLVGKADLLDDVIQGKYTMQDIEIVKGETDAVFLRGGATNKIVGTPVQMFSEVVEATQENMRKILNKDKSKNFFIQMYDPELCNTQIPIPINDAMRRSILAVELLSHDPLDTNEAKQAADALAKAAAMQEAENKIREVIKSSEKQKEKSEQEKTDESMAESAAIAGAFSDDIKRPKGFNITEEEFDVIFSPDDDSEGYKPIEIISYMGMTN